MSDKEKVAEDGDPTYVFGVSLKAMPDGQGIKFDPIIGREFARKATINDIMGACSAIGGHIQQQILAGMIVQGLEKILPEMIANQIENMALFNKVKRKVH